MDLQYQGLLVKKEIWEFKIYSDGKWTMTDTQSREFYRNVNPTEEAKKALETLQSQYDVYLTPIETVYKGAFQDSDKSNIFAFSIDELGRVKIRQLAGTENSEFYVNSHLDVKKKARRALEKLQEAFEVTLF